MTAAQERGIETLGILELAPVTSTHILLAKASHMANFNIKRVRNCIPPMVRRAGGSKYLLNNNTIYHQTQLFSS